jgi:hypothetical protein
MDHLERAPFKEPVVHRAPLQTQQTMTLEWQFAGTWVLVHHLEPVGQEVSASEKTYRCVPWMVHHKCKLICRRSLNKSTGDEHICALYISASVIGGSHTNPFQLLCRGSCVTNVC